jgi:DNA-binding CsgD family transcriptional regulator
MDRSQPDFTAEEAAVMKVIEDDTVAFYNKDFEAYARCWVQAPYARRLGWWTHGGVVDRSGWDEIATRTRLIMRNNPDVNASAARVMRENVVIRVGQDMAWVTFDQYAPDSGEPDMDMPGLSRETRILEKHDGEWRIAYMGFIHHTAERVPAAMLRVDAAGNVGWMNKAAEAQVTGADHLVVRHGQLRAVTAASNERLKKAIAVAAKVDDKLDGDRAAIPIVLDSATGDEALVTWVLSEGGGSGAVIISINDLQFAQDKLRAAAAVYGFSSMQLRLAEFIVTGNDLAGCAQYLGVSVNTVRTHLRRIFDKTGARNQPTLVRTLLSVTAPVE